MFQYCSVSLTVSIYANLYHVLYIFAGYLSDEQLACKEGGVSGYAAFKDTPACGICYFPYKKTTEAGKDIKISGELGFGVAGKLAGIGLSGGATVKGETTWTSKEITHVAIDKDLPGWTGKIFVHRQITKFTLQKWKKEFQCRPLDLYKDNVNPFKIGVRLVTHYKWVATGETKSYEIPTSFCDIDKTTLCTTKSPTVSFIALSLYLIYLLELTSHN